MPPRLVIDPTALIAMRDNGDSHEAMAEIFACSRSTIERRLLALPPRMRQCAHCVLDRDAEVARLREAYLLLEEALFAFFGATRPGAVGGNQEVEHGKGQVSESSSPAGSPSRRECVFEEKAA